MILHKAIHIILNSSNFKLLKSSLPKDPLTANTHELPHLLCVAELSFEFLLPQLALFPLTLQALYALSDGSQTLPHVCRSCTSLIQLFLIGTKRSSHDRPVFTSTVLVVRPSHSPAEAFCPVRPQSASSAEQPFDSVCCCEKPLPPGGSF